MFKSLVSFYFGYHEPRYLTCVGGKIDIQSFLHSYNYDHSAIEMMKYKASAPCFLKFVLSNKNELIQFLP